MTDNLAQHYRAELREICERLHAGDPPWWGVVAQKGPAILSRSGAVLRGLPAVIAWHVGDKLPTPTLVWRLVPEDEFHVSKERVVFLLPSYGGEALYGAVPFRKPRQISDAPIAFESESVTEQALTERLEVILTSLGAIAPSLDADKPAIVSLALATLRRLGVSSWPLGSVPWPEEWSPRRLARVSSWARLLADDVSVSAAGSGGGTISPPGRWSALRREPHEGVAAQLDGLAHSAWLQNSLPAELREFVPQSKRFLVPELPLRKELFNTKELRRAPAVGGLAKHLEARAHLSFSGERVHQLLSAAGWTPHAALGLALVEELNIEPFPSEPGTAWRFIGNSLRMRMQGGEKPPVGLRSLPCDPKTTGAVGLWRDMSRDHLLSSWVNDGSRLRVWQLSEDDRWDSAALDRLVSEVKPAIAESKRGATPLDWLPIVRVSLARKGKNAVSLREEDHREILARALGCEPAWSAVRGAVAQSEWERYKIPKNSGGYRWLDIPAEPLKRAQRSVHELLLAITPETGATTAFHPGARPALHAKAHAGAIAAVRVDIADFFGSLRPEHLRPWLGDENSGQPSALSEWSDEGREALIELIFRRRAGRPPYLPQGAPSSPAAANLAGRWLDNAVVFRGHSYFGKGRFCYTRYADDLVLSTRHARAAEGFADVALGLLREAVEDQGFTLQESKTVTWSAGDGEAFHVCGLRVPRALVGRVALDRPTWRRSRAALHRLRHRLDYGVDAPGDPNRAHGLLAYAYSATGDLRWVGYTSARLSFMARALAGLLFSESFLAGWADEDIATYRGER